LLRVAKVTPYDRQYDDVATGNAVYPSVHPSRVRGNWGLWQGRSRRDVRPCVTCRSAAGSRSRATWCESGSQFLWASSHFRVADRGASRATAWRSMRIGRSYPIGTIDICRLIPRDERASGPCGGRVDTLTSRARGLPTQSGPAVFA